MVLVIGRRYRGMGIVIKYLFNASILMLQLATMGYGLWLGVTESWEWVCSCSLWRCCSVLRRSLYPNYLTLPRGLMTAQIGDLLFYQASG
ncbi:hypothetical protein UMZ34_21200 [Halopseudomonas pachastrellae]|nr:hypothetical protein UMZ34_21200 [Halopseudomonas pachastrellae]